MDFLILVFAYIPYIFTESSVNLQGLRVVRVLRPLKTIARVK